MRIPFVKIRVFCGPTMIPARVIGHPIDDHFEPHVMGFFHEAFEIIQCAKFLGNRHVIGTGIIAPHAALSILLGNRRNGHEPERMHAHIL